VGEVLLLSDGFLFCTFIYRFRIIITTIITKDKFGGTVYE